MAQFGVTTAMVSIVLSVFMAGLGLGSWASGHWLRRPEKAGGISALRLYALIELLIGISGIVVPYGLTLGRHSLERSGLSSSFGYYFAAGLWVALALLPWCALMGATVPVAMRSIGQRLPAESTRSFSYLYMANVAGAVAGTVIPLVLIELFGFRGTLRFGVAANCLIAASAFALSLKSSPRFVAQSSEPISQPAPASGGSSLLALLFLSGLSSMAMEVVWVRSYTPYYGTVVYSFASILGFICWLLFWAPSSTGIGVPREIVNFRCCGVCSRLVPCCRWSRPVRRSTFRNWRALFSGWHLSPDSSVSSHRCWSIVFREEIPVGPAPPTQPTSWVVSWARWSPDSHFCRLSANAGHW